MNPQPNSKVCFVCGLENPSGQHLRFYNNGKDEVAADFTVQPNHQGYPDVVHGGIVAAILDEAGGRTVMAGDPMRFFMTAKIEIRYRQPLPVGRPLKAMGRLVKLRDRLAAATAEICSAAGDVLAEAELVLTNIPDGMIDLSRADELAWRVYESRTTE